MKLVVYLSIITYIILLITYNFFYKSKKKKANDKTKDDSKDDKTNIIIDLGWIICGFSILLLALMNIQYPDLDIKDFFIKLIGFYAFLSICVFILYVLTTSTTTQSFNVHKIVNSGLSILFYIIISLGGLGILSNMLNYNVVNNVSVFKDIINYLKKQWNITTSTTWIILFVETIVLGGYFLLPKLIKTISQHDTHVLLSKTTPLYLNKETVVGSYQQLYNSKKFPSYHYTLSCEFFINRTYMNHETNCSNIISYGKSPIVCYNTEKNSLTIKSLIKDSNSNVNSNSNGNGENKREVILLDNYHVPFQTWNKLIVQYNSGIMDVFVNDNLVSTTKGIIDYMKFDAIRVGQQNGIGDGSAIRNIQYYNRNLNTVEMLML